MTVYFTEDHEWVKIDGAVATIGITKHAAEQMGQVVFVELKEVGESFAKGDEMGVIESVKAASEIYAPISGEIIEANGPIVDNPEAVNEDPESTSWLYKMKISNSDELKELLDADAYKAIID